MSPPFTIALVQINNSFSGQNYLPFVAGLLQRYVECNAPDPDRYRFLLPIYRRTPVRDAVASLDGADVIGFSTYVWNGRISLEIARRLKQNNPETVIIFGGPHVPDHPEEFLRENSFIDIAVHNEGEATFLELLESLPDRDWAGIPGISYLDQGGEFIRTADRTRFRDLDEVPSPYIDGTFLGAVDGGQSARKLDRVVGDQSRLPVPVHVLRLGLRHGRQSQQVRAGQAQTGGRLVFREEDRIHLLLRRKFRHPEARRRYR